MTCPTEATFRLLGSDKIADETFAEIERHVEECADCRATLERLVKVGQPFDAELFPSDENLPNIPGFIIERELGRGGTGVVYLAFEPAIDRHVALKVVPGGSVAGPKGRARWISEARAVSRLRHTNVVRLYRVDETPEWLVLVFEYIPGGTLKDRLGDKLEANVAVSLVETVALAVVQIHARGLLHLDLKPSNILLDGEPGEALARMIPKVSDFGIARASADPSQTDTSLAGPRGTPSYMAPEQAMPDLARIGPHTDVFALGVLLYHMLTGRTPFQSDSIFETIEKLRNASPVPPSRINRRVPRDLERICLTCLAKHPENRYPSAEALAADLRAWMERRKPKLAGRLGRAGWRSRLPQRALPLAAVMMVVVLVIVMARAKGWMGPWGKSAQSVSDLRGWIRQMLDNPQRLKGNELQELLRATHAHTLALKQDLSVDSETLASLAILERSLGVKFHAMHDHQDESRLLIKEAIELLEESVRRSPGDEELVYELAVSLMNNYSTDEYIEVTMESMERAAQLAMELKLADRRRNIFTQVSDCRRLQANQFLCLGNPEMAARILESDLRMFERLDPADAERLNIAFRKQLALAALFQRPVELEQVRRLARADASAFQHSAEREELIQMWIAFITSLYVFPEKSPIAVDPATDSEGFHDAWIAEFRVIFDAVGIDLEMIPRALLDRLTNPITSISSAYRSEMNQVGMSRVEHRFMAMANGLTRLFPDQAESFLILSEAYMQACKNAWNRSQDPQAIEMLRLSRDAARKASNLAPLMLRARATVEDRERRLARSLGG